VAKFTMAIRTAKKITVPVSTKSITTHSSKKPACGAVSASWAHLSGSSSRNEHWRQNDCGRASRFATPLALSLAIGVVSNARLSGSCWRRRHSCRQT
jgi:hypothetical protein